MAQSRSSRVPQPSAKLNSENVGSHQLSSHRNAIANAQKAQQEKPSKNSPSGTASHDNITSTDSGGDASDHELGSTSDATIPNRKRLIIHSDDDDDDDRPASPTSTQQSENPRPKKKKKSKKRTSASIYLIRYFVITADNLHFSVNDDAPSASVQSIDDVSNTEDAPKLNKTQPTADVDHFFKRAPQVKGAKKGRATCISCK